jgi:hypothetical protein
MGGKADIFDLMDKIILAQREDYDQLPGLALRAIGIAVEITDSILRFVGGSDVFLGGLRTACHLSLLHDGLACLRMRLWALFGTKLLRAGFSVSMCGGRLRVAAMRRSGYASRLMKVAGCASGQS